MNAWRKTYIAFGVVFTVLTCVALNIATLAHGQVSEAAQVNAFFFGTLGVLSFIGATYPFDA